MGQIEDYNNYIRYLTKTNYKFISNIYNTGDDTRKKQIFLKSLCTNEFEKQRLKQYFNMSEEAIIKSSAITTMIKYQLYIDYYKKLNLDKRLDRISELDKYALERLHSTNAPQEISDLTTKLDSNIQYSMLDTTLEYSSISVYEKILQVKALSGEDIEKLTSISPFFKSEKDKYDIDITIPFIADRIKKLNSDITYTETVDFIFDLYRVKEKEAVVFLDDLKIEYGNCEVRNQAVNSNDIVSSYGYVSKEELKVLLTKMKKDYDDKAKEILKK